MNTTNPSDAIRSITLQVTRSYLTGCYTIGNKDLVLEDLGNVEVRNRYIIPDHQFRFDGQPTLRGCIVKIYDFDELLFSLKRAAGRCSDYYRLSNIRVHVCYSDDIPRHISSNVNRLIRKVNEYMEFIDDLNQYEEV